MIVSENPTNSLAPSLVAHIVFSFDVGGLENGIVNLINYSDPNQFNHVIICLSHYTKFFKKIKRSDVRIYALNKKPGKDLLLFFRLFKLLKQLKPDIVHTRNIATLECQLPAFLAGVKARVHGEHGWDMVDLSGDNKKYQYLRKLFVPLVNQYIALSKEGFDYLHHIIGINKNKINHIYNGVDTNRFTIKVENQTTLEDLVPKNFIAADSLVFGTVGRMAEVKNQLFLIRAFIHLLESYPEVNKRARLLIVGDGILMKPAVKLLEDFCNKQHCDNQWVHFAGESERVNDLMRLMHIFVLPSLAEGISNTILEAMATSLPVIATDVGGNSELVENEQTGFIVPVNDVDKLTDTMKYYLDNPGLASRHGKAGRIKIEENFSLKKMVNQYENIYLKVLK